MSQLEVRRISKSFEDTPILKGVSFSVDEGEVVFLLGPSGCGKTTLLRIIAGLETADEGNVLFAGRDLAAIPVHRRGFGLMFQDYVLFPHKDVEANVAFGLRMQGLAQPEIRERVTEVLGLVSLQGYERRQVFQLSGGEQQRVALARSLAPNPSLLMLDEPLGSLDRTLREGLMGELRAILKRVGVTTLYVTHDQEEAYALADRVLIMQEGRIVQEGTPQEVYRLPASEFVARFLGLSNLLPGRVTALAAMLEITTPLGPLTLDPQQGPTVSVGDEITLVIRLEAATLISAGQEEAEPNLICGTVLDRSFRGGSVRLRTLHPGDVELEFEMAAESELPPRDSAVCLSLDSRAIAWLPPA
ncbi:MAG TPA: ABC transporter ATP-binding protein [Anaerolineae bacterium]|nr:ABC transporter ATP-binding protein [Anaerolineae bacterium]